MWQRKRIVAVLSCKIALKSIPRWGTIPLLMLTAGLFLLFPVWNTLLIIQAERNTPFEVMATVSADTDLRILNEMEQIAGFTPVADSTAEVEWNGHTLTTSLRAVQGDYLNLDFTAGMMYPDSSNMPYVVINQAAAKSFSQDEQIGSSPVGAGVSLTVDGVTVRANICGIFTDDSQTPQAYLSYALAREKFFRSGETTVLIRMTGGIVDEKTVSALRRAGLNVSVDEIKTIEWEYRNRQLWQEAALCLCVLISAILLLKDNRKLNRKSETEQRKMLQMSGFRETETRNLDILQIVVAVGACLLAAGILAACAGWFSLPGVESGIGVVLLLVPVLKNPRWDH